MAKVPGKESVGKHQDPSGPAGHAAHVKAAIKHGETHGTMAHFHEDAAQDSGFTSVPGVGMPPSVKK